jgi:hypothetical protein
MAKISNTLSYPNQSPIEGADYLIGTAANSSPIDKQTKTFTIQGIADFVIDQAFDGVSYRLPVFTGSTSGVESVKLVNSLIYQDTATDGTDPTAVGGTTVYINDGNGVGSLIVSQDISAVNASLSSDLTVNGRTELNGQIRLTGPVYDANTQVGNTEQVLVSDNNGNVTWQNFQGSGLEFQGTWNADTNTPDLQAIPLIPGNTGKYWVVSVAGNTDLGGLTDWEPQDWAIISEDDAGNVFWAKIDNSPVITGQGTPGNITLWTGTREIGDAPIVISPIPGGTSLNFNDTANNVLNGGPSNVFGSGNSISEDFALLGGQDSDLNADHSIGWGSSLTIEGSSVAAFGDNNTVDADYSITAGRSNNISGLASAVVGSGNTVSGDHSFAAGQDNDASAEYSFAIGVENQASGLQSFAGGEQSQASGQISFAFGAEAIASGQKSFALGNSESSGDGAFSGGSSSEATGTNTFAYGDSVVGGGKAQFTGGTSTNNQGDNSIVIGDTLTTSALATHAAVFGKQNTVVAPGSIAAGELNTINAGATSSGANSAAFGYQNTVNLDNDRGGFALGSDNLVEGSSSAAIGRNNSTIGFNSFTAGQNNLIEVAARESIALGDSNKITGSPRAAVALGQSSQASTDGAVAIGTSAIAQTGTGAIAIGNTPNAQGQDSLALGTAAVTGQGAQNAVAIGDQASATASNAFAIGPDAAASGSRSTALGSSSEATGASSVAIGVNSTANGTASLALPGATTNAYYSIAGGSGSLSNAESSIALGNNNNIVEDQGIGHVALGNQNNVNDIAVADPGSGNFALGHQNTISGSVGAIGEQNTYTITGGGVSRKAIVIGNSNIGNGIGTLVLGNNLDLTNKGSNIVAIGGASRTSFFNNVNNGEEIARFTPTQIRLGKGVTITDNVANQTTVPAGSLIVGPYNPQQSMNSNSIGSAIVGDGNQMQNAPYSAILGQSNTLDGTNSTESSIRSHIIGFNNSMTDTYSSFIAGGNSSVTTDNNGFSLGFSNSLAGQDSMFAFGENNTGPTGANDRNSFMIGGQLVGSDKTMNLGFRNNVSEYPATDRSNGLGDVSFSVSTGLSTTTNSNALLITEGGINGGAPIVPQVPRVILPTVPTFSASNDAAADAIGIPEGGLYQNNGVVQINRGGGSTVNVIEQPIIINGMVVNLASQGSGGYDYMEFVSNVTPETQMPVMKIPYDLTLVGVTFHWMGSSALSLQTNEQVEFTIGTIPSGSNPIIGNYTSQLTLFTIDSSDSGTWANDVVSGLSQTFSQGDVIVVVGQETGTVTPNDGELSITLSFIKG